MFVSINTLHCVPAHAANLDSNKLPKTSWFGGALRARRSSQSLKRERRLFLGERGLPSSVRTRLIRGRLTELLVRAGRDADEASQVVRAGLEAIGLAMVKDHPERTQYLLFLGEDEIAGLADALHEADVWDELTAIVHAAQVDVSKKAKGSAVESKLAREAMLEVFGAGSRAVDLALFGRMVADRDDLDVAGAVQVAHSLGVTRHQVERDWWIAADDLLGGGGAGMVESSWYAGNSIYYDYTTVDVGLLVRNLGRGLAQQALEAYAWSVPLTAPSGRRNSMSAYTPPSLMLATVGTRQPWSLANAFLQPVRTEGDVELITGATSALDAHLVWARDTYGPLGEQLTLVAGQTMPQAAIGRVTIPELIDAVVTAAFQTP